MKKALGRASTSEGNDEHTKEKLAALLSASALKVLDAACALYVLGSSGEEREARGREHHAVGAPGSGRRA
jgi:hypothetical protein